MTNASDFFSGPDQGAVVDARHTDGPVTLIRLKSEIKSAPFGALITVLTAEPDAEKNIRSFCSVTCNQYVGADHLDGYVAHRIKKTQPRMECETCSNIRTILSGAATLIVLALTTPDIIVGGASGASTILFVLSLCALPPVAYNNFRLIAKTAKRAFRSRESH